MRINFITHESADGVPRRWLRTEVYPKTLPELVSEAAGTLLFVILDLCRPVEKAKAAHHENR